MRFFSFLFTLSVGLQLTTYAQTLTTSNLPIVLINTNGQSIPDDPKLVCDLRIIDNGAGKRNNVTDKPSFTSKIGIELRGSTSQDFPKKPYGFELRDASGANSVDASILGMPSEADWVLNATYVDKTLIREPLIYDLGRQISKYYVPRYRYCELILNGKYEGLYILFEKIKRNKNRVDVSSIKKTDISGDAVTGGYIFKIDKYTGEESRMWTSTKQTNGIDVDIQIERPKIEDLTEEQFLYAKKFVTEFENALAGPKYQDATVGYPKYIKEDSFVDYLLINEICHNIDAYRLSTFFYKDRDSKDGRLVMGPIWDYNLAFGNVGYCQADLPEGWSFDFTRICGDDVFEMPFWWDRLLTDKRFANSVRSRYQGLRTNVLKTERIHAYIDSVANVLTEARTRNFQRWDIIGVPIGPTHLLGQTYQEEINFLKSWVKKRLEWMDKAIVPFGSSVLGTELIPDFNVTLSPNPSTDNVTLRYNLSQRATVQLLITDAAGRSVQRMTWPNQAAGDHEETLPAHSLPTAPGTYILQLNADGKPISRKMVRF
ncbi:CotH kinase family protein [Spirosoma sp. BT702]|uniref:CotH kinase family protein n=1 Tax=Spirosoma profusum TaxID=2771354 RepID=A0A926XWF1_9BACT|nr:CotH kinase family protein [Spirosoma profusum]MBD2701161.1 CotH kinase family protein [Spirosoma profusum]